MNILGIVFALAAGVFFGIIGPVTKTAYNLGAGIGLAIFLRYVVALIIVSPLIPSQKNLLSTYKKNIHYFFLITLSSVMLTTGLLISVTYINVSLTIIIFCTYPIIVLVASMLLSKEKVDSKIKLVFIITFAGLFLVLGPSFKNLNAIGVISGVAASIGASIIILTNQKLSNKNIDPIHINAFINLFNSIFFIIVILLFFKININISLNAWIMILISSFCYAIAFFLQLSAIPRIGQSKTALLLYTEPTVAVLASIFLLKEILNLYQSLGAVIVICSLIYATYQTSKN